MKPSGEECKSDQETANVLNKYFASVFEKEDNQLPDFPEQEYTIELLDVEISEDKVDKLISNIKPSKSQGPDNFHPKLIKETANELKKPLTIIFKKSVDEGRIPEIWKKANVTAIFKKGDRKKAENYRPISLTSVPGKILEKIIRNTIVDHMTSNNLFSKGQHGFIAGRSCVTQLLEFMEDITEAIDSGKEVDVIYLDFCKAFDKVPHKRLLMKMQKYGIKGNILNWVKAFLSERQQRVIVNGSASS